MPVNALFGACLAMLKRFLVGYGKDRECISKNYAKEGSNLSKIPSLKDQIYQSIAESQVRQVMEQKRQQEIAQLQNDYNAWLKQQEDIEKLQRDFEAWKAQNPEQAAADLQTANDIIAQTKPQESAPKAPVQKSQEIPSLSAPKQEMRFYTPKEKAEFIADRKKYLHELRATKANGTDVNKQTADYLNSEEHEKQLEGMANNKAPGKQNTQELMPSEIPEEVINQYAQLNGLSADQARAEIEQQINKAKAMGNTSLKAANDVTIDQEKTAQAQAEVAEQKRKAAQKKQNPWEAALNNAGDAIAGIVAGPVRLAGKALGKDWDLVGDRVRQNVAEANEQHPVASSLGRIAGMAAGAYMLGGGAGGRALSAKGAPTAGEALKAGYEDALVNGGTKAQAILNGAGTAARQLGANTLRDMPIDLATDIIPTLANDVAEEKSTGEIVKNTLLNTAINGGLNAVGDIASLYRPIKGIVGNGGPKVDIPNNQIPELVTGIYDNADDYVVRGLPGGKNDEIISQERANIVEQLRKYANGELSQKDLIQLGATPEYLKDIGDINNPLVMTQSNISKFAYPEGYMGGKHNLGYDAIAEVPNRLNDPAAVMKSLTQPDSGVVLTDMLDAHGDPVIAPVHMGKEKDANIVNELASMHGRPGIDYLLDNSDIIYKNEEKVRDVLSGNGLQLSKQKATADPLLNYNIAEGAENVNKESINKVMAEDIGLNSPKPQSEKSIEGVWKLEESPKTTEDLWSELEKGSQGQQPTPPVRTSELNERGQKLSRLHETLQNTEMLTDAEKQAYADKNGFWYDPDNERALAEQAKAEVAQDLDGVYKQYAEGTDPGKLSGADAHKMFTASFDYSKMAQEALESGDQAAAKLYNQKARNIMLNAREAATKGGQFNAAIAYYSKTPQGYIDKAYGLLDKQIGDFKAKNPKLSNGIDELSKGVSDMLKDIDVESILTGTDEAAKDSLRRNVLDGISDMIEKSNNKQLKNAFKNLSLTDMDEIIASNYQADIARTLDMFSMGSFGVKPETVDKVMDIFAEAEKYGYNSKEYYKMEQEAFNLLANDLCNGKSFGEKLNAWRYFSMLSNPLTHIKNNLGNLNNNILTGVKNNIAASIEAAADRIAKAKGLEGIDGGRTKTFLNPIKDRDLISGAAKDFDDFSFRQYKEGGNKWLNASQELSRAGHTFKDKGLGKAANFLTEGNADLLDVEDIVAGKAKYQTSLAGFLKANGADASIFNATDDASKELLAQGRQYALNQANEATFHQSNAFAEWWSKNIRAAKESDSAALKGLGYTADTVLPFVKTPSNILAQSFAYSPLEFVKVVAETGKLKRGQITAAQYINDIAKGVTGTMGLALGALLQHEGILYVGTGDKDLDAYNAKRGINPMTIKVGKKYVSLSELAPAAMSLISGATSWYYLKQALNGDGDMALDALTSGVYSMAESINDMTMLNGVADTLSAVRYADSDTDVLSSIGRTVAGNFVGQLLPTVGGKVEKTIDDTKRTTYTDKKGKAAKYWAQEGNYLKTKIPGLQEAGEQIAPQLPALGDYMTNEASIGPWGEELKQQDYGLGTGGRIINNFLNPLATTTDASTAVDDELRALYNDTHETKLLNYGLNASSNSSVDGNKLTPKEWTAFSKEFGSLKYELAESLMNMDGYKDMTPEDKVEAYDQLGKFAKAYAYNQATGKELKSTNQGYADSYKQGGAKAVVEQIAAKSQGKSAAEAAGVKSNSAAGKAIAEAAQSGDTQKVEQLTESTKTLSDYGLTHKGPYETYEKAQQVIPSLSAEDFAKTYKSIDADGNQGIKQDEIIDYLNKTHASQAEGKKIWNAYGNSTWKKIPSLEDGVWSKKAN